MKWRSFSDNTRRLPLASLAIFLFAQAPSLKAQTADIYFSYLYGNSHGSNPTVISNGTGALGEAMEGQSFYWVCLDLGLTTPDDLTMSYTLSTDPASLAGGLWSSMITDPSTRSSITTGVSNMYHAFRSELLADNSSAGFNNLPGTGFQEAVWYITEGYERNIWSGTLNQDAVDALIAWDGATTSLSSTASVTWIADMLQATQTASAGGQIIFANPVGAPGFQPVALLPYSPIVIPEPSALALLSGAGLTLVLRRRRIR